MSKKSARKAAKDLLLSGYTHHSYELEEQISNYIFNDAGNQELLEKLTLYTYADVLGPNRIRAMKNGLICAIALLSRTAINYGVDSEQSFALSDYYILEVEKQTTEQSLNALLHELLDHYAEMVHNETYRAYSLQITKAVRYMNKHLYGSCTIQEIAAAVNLNPQYLASLFKKEVGITPSAYLQNIKMKEARTLLLQNDYSVAEIAEILGYCNTSYFIKIFKKTYGKTPKQYIASRPSR